MKAGFEDSGNRGKAFLDLADFAAVRACGRGVVEGTRRKTLEGAGSGNAAAAGDIWRQLEAAAATEAAASVGGGAGGPTPRAARAVLERVLGAERDVILAHSLYRAAVGGSSGSDGGGGGNGESGGAAAPRTIVGVVGAAHVPGIVRLWPTVDAPDVSEAARELSRMPGGGRGSSGGGDGGSGSLPAVATGALLVALAARRPKVALFIVGSAAALATPFVVAAAGAMDKWSKLGAMVGEAAVRLDDEEGGGSG